MNNSIEQKSWTIRDSHSIISFETTGGDDWDIWDRYIAIDGKKLFISVIFVELVHFSLKG